MTDRKAESEPSMEEILSSIRRIISEGGDAGDKGAPASGPRSETQDQVLDLTDVVQDDGTVVSLADRAKGKPEAKPSASAAEADPEPDEAAAPPLPPPPSPPAPPQVVKAAPKAPPPIAAAVHDDGLISSETAQATAAALANLAASVTHESDDGSHVPLGTPGRTLEDIVKELMRPMIQNWLDANLPAITERLVRREIQRIANRVESD